MKITTNRLLAALAAGLFALAVVMQNTSVFFDFSGYTLSTAHSYCASGVWTVCNDVQADYTFSAFVVLASLVCLVALIVRLVRGHRA
jgi:hypothetical protein